MKTYKRGISSVIIIATVLLIVVTATVIVLVTNSNKSNEVIEGVKLPDTVTHMFNNALANCSNLRAFITGSNLKILGEYVFNYCISLSEVELNDGLEEIQFGCFSNNNIRELYIPSSVTKLDAPIYVSNKKSITIVSEEGSETQKNANKLGLKFMIK